MKNKPINIKGNRPWNVREDVEKLINRDKNKCLCDLRTRLVGDGCSVCNPELAKEMMPQSIQPAKSKMKPNLQNPEQEARRARRRRVIYVPEKYVLALLRAGGRAMEPNPIGLPESAQMIGVWPDYSRNAFALVVEDDTFEETPEGMVLPEMKVEWRNLHS